MGFPSVGKSSCTLGDVLHSRSCIHSTRSFGANDSRQNEGAGMPLEIDGDRIVGVGSIAARARTARSRIAADVRRVSNRKAEIPPNWASRVATYKPIAIGRVAGRRRTGHGAVARITEDQTSRPLAGQVTGDRSHEQIQVGANEHTTSG